MKLADRPDLISKIRHTTDKYNVDKAIKGCMVGALVHTNWNVTESAFLTGISRQTFWRKMKEYKIERK